MFVSKKAMETSLFLFLFFFFVDGDELQRRARRGSARVRGSDPVGTAEVFYEHKYWACIGVRWILERV